MHEQAENDYLQGMKYKDIAEKYGVSINTVKSWKQRYGWMKGVRTKPKKDAHKKEDAPDKEKLTFEVMRDDALTDKQRLFCLYYVKYWNAGKAAKKAKYECNYENGFYEIGSQLLKKTQVRNEIDRLKGSIFGSIFLEAKAVLQKYIDIAFADITDYVTFGKREEQVIGMYGPVFSGKGDDKEPVMQEINFVDLKDSSEIDGTLITEVKQGKDGVSVKLADKMKALEKLAMYFDLFPDTFKRRIEEEKLKLEERKVKKEEEGPIDEKERIHPFIEALTKTAGEVWDDEEE